MTDRHWKGQKLTQEFLRSHAGPLLAHPERPDITSGTFNLAIQLQVIRHFLGQDWIVRYMLPQSNDSFLKPVFGADGHATKFSMLILNLADMLFNLQSVDGFENCLDQLSAGQLESGLAELQVGMLLYQNRYDFRYINPLSVVGHTYDLEINLRDGGVACGELKCKVETTELTATTIENSINDARKQLPKGREGIVFIKVPQHWISKDGEELKLPQEIWRTTIKNLRGTTRVALVIFYVFHLTYFDGHTLNRHSVAEITNPKMAGNPRWENDFLTQVDVRWTFLPDLIARLLPTG